ncbi:M14 family metallopeptidase [Paraglaciecola aquimarina]|uniref:M14 family metallopeptidase n=1 Tax=Paraglaciecola aquimarina TaxID=1235557 RepID=A0ABU3SZ38_9ALTE|nr:M14 family metallopeptidase [Paraglaciecola aquimarina]MDU0355232.1 M14 family metallopeptidase [Paraglaciecola aquimarina]
MNVKNKVLNSAMFVALWLFSNTVVARTIEVAGTSVVNGSRVDINISVGGTKAQPETFIPVTVINGSHDGPVLATIAGVHGYEYTSILATEKWLANINPKDLSGSIIAVRVAHIPAFEEKSIYVNPTDRKNLNRSFPGRVDGSQTDKIAWRLSTQVIAKADFVIDLHSGDGAEWLDAFVGVYGGPLSSNYSLAIRVAKGFQLPNIVTYKMNTQKQIDKRRSLNRQAVASGLPTILVEIGENGSKKPEHIQSIVEGLDAAIQILGIRSKVLASQGNINTPHNPRTLGNTRYFADTFAVTVNHSGLWFPKLLTGQFVNKGDTLGTIKSYFGKSVETVLAPNDGFALYGLSGPSVKKGQSIMTIAKPVNN